jgi:hypothetical protein
METNEARVSSGGFVRTRHLSLIVVVVVATMLTATIAVASSSKPTDAKYAGETGPGYPMHFEVIDNGSRVSKLVVAFEATCDPGAGSVAPDFDFGSLTIHDGSFSGATNRSFGPTVSDSVRIDAKFKDDRFTGDVTDTQRITSLPTCTQSEPFSAKAVS